MISHDIILNLLEKGISKTCEKGSIRDIGLIVIHKHKIGKYSDITCDIIRFPWINTEAHVGNFAVGPFGVIIGNFLENNDCLLVKIMIVIFYVIVYK